MAFIGFPPAPFTVGYAQSDLKPGATMATPQFLPVSGETISLDDLVPTGDGTSDSVVIQTLDAAGGTVDTYAWNDRVYGKGCWVDSNFAEATGVTFAPGQGLWVYGANPRKVCNMRAR